MRLNVKYKTVFVSFLVLAGLAMSAEPVKAPDFKLTDANGKEVQLSKLLGHVVVLEWANYDCPFVKAHYNKKTHTMKDLAAKYADKKVVWLTINSTHYATAETNKAWAEQHQLKQPVLLDADGKVGKLYGAKNHPASVYR